MSIFEIVRGSVFVLTAINIVAFIVISHMKPEWSAWTTARFMSVREVNIISNLLGPAIMALLITATLFGGCSAVFGIGELLFHQELALISAFYQHQEALLPTVGGVGGFILLFSYVFAIEQYFDIPPFSPLTFTDPVSGKTDDVLSKF